MSQKANEQCQDCQYLEKQLKAVKDKDYESKYLNLNEELAEIRGKLDQAENQDMPKLRAEKQKLEA